MEEDKLLELKIMSKEIEIFLNLDECKKMNA